MPDAVDLSYAIGLAPEDAIRYFRQKGYAFSWDWHEVWQEAHAKAFTVAKAMKLDILQDIRGAVDRAIAEGTTLDTFRKELQPLLEKKGWWGKTLEDGKAVQLGSPWRLETIFRANVQSAYAAGRYKQQVENAQDRPHWQYVAIMDSRTRPEHAYLNGKVFDYDDPFWDTHYPPLDFRCRCRVRALSRQNLIDRGLNVAESQGRITWKEQEIAGGVVRPVAGYRDPDTGKTIYTGPGWSGNPGKSAWFPDLDRYDYGVAAKWVEGGLTGDDFTAFFNGNIQGNYPVAVLPEAYRRLIGARSQTVYLSSDTLNKQLGKTAGNPGHPELTMPEYQRLPGIIQNAQLVVRDGDLTIAFFRAEGRIYYVAVKATKTGETLFVTSFRRSEMKEVDSIRKKGTVLKDDL